MNCPQRTPALKVAGSRERSTGAGGSLRATSGLTALVVDDDPAILELTVAMLCKIGFKVRTASEGAEAIFDFHNSPSDIVLSNYEMPAINGYQLGRKIKSHHPRTRILIMTGLGRTAVTGLMSDDTIDGWLFKPFCLEELITLLERVGLTCAASTAPIHGMDADHKFDQ